MLGSLAIEGMCMQDTGPEAGPLTRTLQEDTSWLAWQLSKAYKHFVNQGS